jgi:hypothetical protein
MVLRSIMLVLVGAALGAVLQYSLEAPHKTSEPIEASVTVNHALSPTQTIESAFSTAGGDNSHIERIRRAHAALRSSAVSGQPPTLRTERVGGRHLSNARLRRFQPKSRVLTRARRTEQHARGPSPGAPPESLARRTSHSEQSRAGVALSFLALRTGTEYRVLAVRARCHAMVCFLDAVLTHWKSNWVRLRSVTLPVSSPWRRS